MINKGIESVFQPNSITPAYQDRTGVILALRPQSFLASAEDLSKLSDFLGQQSQHYEDIQAPLLLITGDSDTVVPPWNHAERLIKQVPHAELVVLENTGHAPHHTHSERVVIFITQFVREATKADSGAASR